MERIWETRLWTHKTAQGAVRKNGCEIRREKFYYVDKTGLIRELLQGWGKVNLFTRPRRFGKSLNMGMLKTFFEIGGDPALFAGLEIMREEELCRTYMGRFPVISISLKGVSGEDFATARAMLCAAIGSEALRFPFLAESEALDETEKKLYRQLTKVDEESRESFVMPDSILMSSLRTLSALLCKHYGQKALILIDEYDVPLAKAFERNYYNSMTALIRNLFEQALKTNESLYFAVLTGCMRISKESIFTGLNNLNVLSVTDVEFDEYFGFTDQEVQKLLAAYDLAGSYDIIKNWYDGYRFGNAEVYCPWDVLCYCNKLRVNREAQPEAYWSNTSSNDVIRHFIKMARGTTKREIEQLMAGETVEKTIRQELTYQEMYDSIDHLWSVLFTTGYLTQRGITESGSWRLTIPNREIHSIFRNQIKAWFREETRQDGTALNGFCEAFKRGDASAAEKQLQAYLKKTIHIRDTYVQKERKENFYHGILLGLLSYKESWVIASSQEAGEGYSDIQIEIDDEEIGIIIEVKYSATVNTLEKDCRRALEQIEKKKYAEPLAEAGMRTILKYGIACYKKQCRVMRAVKNQVGFMTARRLLPRVGKSFDLRSISIFLIFIAMHDHQRRRLPHIVGVDQFRMLLGVHLLERHGCLVQDGVGDPAVRAGLGRKEQDLLRAHRGRRAGHGLSGRLRETFVRETFPGETFLGIRLSV